MSALLEVKDLGTWFYTRQGIVKAVDNVDFQVAAGETLAIVGESGCGKSMTALSLMRLIPDPPGRIVSGTVKLGGRELLTLSEEEMRRVRGNEISMIFQEPMTSLNPVLTIGQQIAEALVLHRKLPQAEAMRQAVAGLANWTITGIDGGAGCEGAGDGGVELTMSCKSLETFVAGTTGVTGGGVEADSGGATGAGAGADGRGGAGKGSPFACVPDPGPGAMGGGPGSFWGPLPFE